MDFLNRIDEKKRLKSALGSNEAQLVVIYGRRRIGKSTLIRQVLKKKDIYFFPEQNKFACKIGTPEERYSSFKLPRITPFCHS